MDAALAAAVPQLRDAARGEVNVETMAVAMSGKAKTALILASIAAAFFIGVVIRHWVW
jgi:hypothetical protein